MTTIELTPEQQKVLDATKAGAVIVDPRTKAEYFLVPADQAQDFLDYVDARDPEQLAWARMAGRTMVKRLQEDEE